ncbi:MAG TPA: hypothetical protein VFV49_16395 [Thermoanaerobaculia bacterium]|nr:hypothetical protein [Thermoanaerobaculia bacterium]
MRLRLLSAALLILASFSAFAATQGTPIPVPLPLFPANNWWNLDISNAPVDDDSADYISFIGGILQQAHPDFGGDDGEGGVYGFPYIVVDGSQTKKTVDFVLYPGQSDGVGVPFYPVPDQAINTFGWIEGGQVGTEDLRDDADRHILIVDQTNNHLYELYNVWYNGTNWEAGSGAFFDMDTNNRRPEGWTSADAAGLAILPGLVRYDEVFGPDEIRHAFRVTVQATNGYVWPASHVAGSTSGALPMGARLRLKAGKNISGYAPEIQKIFRAMKKYGLIVADNGSNLYVSGVYNTNWDNDILNPAFHSLKASDFDVIDLGWHPAVTFVLSLPSVMGAGDAATGTLTAYNANYTVATGYTGTVQFTSTDGAATLPTNYTFTGGDAGVHTFPAGFILRTAGSQIVTVTDVATATNTTSAGVTVGPATPTLLTATGTGPTTIQLNWGSSTGATQYEIARKCSAADFMTLTTTASTNYTDPGVSSGAACLYKVRAIDAFSRYSPYTAADAATTFSFTDNPVVANATAVKATHMTELRLAVNALRTTAGLGSMSFSAPAPATNVAVRSTTIQELRTAADQARAALGLSVISYTDPLPSTIKALHVQQLRTAVQ